MANDIVKWLASAGFERLIDAFIENEVDWDVFLQLNNEDLKDLGVSKLGERKRLLTAIAKYSAPAEVPAPQPHTSPAVVQDAPDLTYRAEAEFRQLTVMFCDLVGSTELSRQVGAEELRRIIVRYQKACVDAVQPLGGFVARFMGDGVLVYFGYPRADESDAERAVTAGLAVVEACARASTGSVRVGIATGRVIVGDLIGSGPAEERTVVGETPNLAARLQSLAQPDSVVVSDTTRQLAGGGFHFTDLGKHTFKGYDEALSMWEVVGVKSIASRFESSHGAGINPLVGRNNELMLMVDRWQLAAGGEGQAVFISGEAGIGKSRLIESLREEVSASRHVSLRYQCSSHYSTSAFYPIIQQLQRAARFEVPDSADNRLDKLEILLRKLGQSDKDAARIFAHLLSIPFEHRYGTLVQSPQEVKALTLELLVAHVLALAEHDPVLILVEDTQWMDPASEEFMELVIGRMQQSRVLLVVTHRTGWQPSLPGVNNVSSLQLNRLGRESCATIVRAIAGDFVTDAIVNRIVLRTDGIPLFVEELTKSLVEGGLEIADADIPATLQASLLARIDRLGSQAKDIVQVAAVIGREFSLALLEAVAGKQSEQLMSGLGQLVQSELLFMARKSNSTHYSFKHALVQDSVYDSMLTEVRKAHHQKIAQALVDDFPQTVETAPELVAFHFTQAKSLQQAIAYWHRAGKRSAGRSADAESVAQLEQAVEILESVAESPEILQESLSLHIDLTGPLIAIGGWSSEAMEKNTQRALDLAERLQETHRIFPVLYSRFVFHLHTGHVEKACELASEFLELANRNGEEETIIQGHRLRGFALLVAGRVDVASTHLQTASDYRSPEQGGSLPFVYGQDIEAAAQVLAAVARLHQGYPEQAVELFDQALARAKMLDHANTLGVVLFHGGNLFVSLRLEARVKECLVEMSALIKKHDLTLWRVAQLIIESGLRSLTGEHDKVIESVGPTLNTYNKVLRMNIHTTFMLAQVADANIGLNQAEDAINVANRALNVSKSTGAHLEDPDVMRILAKAIHVKDGYCARADEAYASALEKARTMKLKWYELRVAADYARYLTLHGKGQDGKAILKPIVDTFTEGYDMPDLIDAIAVLDAC